MLETTGPMQTSFTSISDEILRHNYQFQLRSSNFFPPYLQGAKYNCDATIEEMSPRTKEQKCKLSSRSPTHLSPENDRYHGHNSNNNNNRHATGNLLIRPKPISGLHGNKRIEDRKRNGTSHNERSPSSNRTGDEYVDRSPPKSSKRYKGFGISDIIGEESDREGSENEHVGDKRKLAMDNEIESKRRRSVSDESNPQNSPETHQTPPSGMMLPNYMTPYPNPYFVNALAGQTTNPAILPLAPHLLADPDAMLRPTLHPAFGANPAFCVNSLPMNPHLMPQMMKRPMPGYDARYLMEQQQKMLLMLNQAKLNPWYQMNPFLRAMAAGSADPMLLASLMSAKNRLEPSQSTESEEIQSTMSGPYLNTLQNIDARKHFFKQVYDQNDRVNQLNDVTIGETNPRNDDGQSPELKRKMLAAENSKKSENISERRDDKRRGREPLHPQKVCSESTSKQSLPKPSSPKIVPLRKLHRERSPPNKVLKLPPKIISNNKSTHKQYPKSCSVKPSNDAIDNKHKSGGESSSTKPTSYKNLTRERRLVANARERTRVHTISSAFEELRTQIPSYSCNQKLSKLAILRIACSYIKSLSVLSGYDVSDEDKFEDSVESCTKVLQSESRARSRRKSNRNNADFDDVESCEKNVPVFTKSSSNGLNKHQTYYADDHQQNETTNDNKYEEEVNVED